MGFTDGAGQMVWLACTMLLYTSISSAIFSWRTFLVVIEDVVVNTVFVFLLLVLNVSGEMGMLPVVIATAPLAFVGALALVHLSVQEFGKQRCPTPERREAIAKHGASVFKCGSRGDCVTHTITAFGYVHPSQRKRHIMQRVVWLGTKWFSAFW